MGCYVSPTAVLSGRHIAMNQADSHGAFTYSRGTALDRIMPDIPCRKDSGHISFEVVGIAVERPIVWRFAVSEQIGAGDEIAAFIANNADLLRPLRMRDAAKAEKKPIGLGRPLF